MQRFKISKVDVGKRTDIFIAEKLPRFSRSALKGLFKQKLVLVNGKAEEPGDKLKSDDEVTVDTRLLDIEPSPIILPIVYEDDGVIVIDKPTGILTHSKGALNTEATVASFIKEKFKGKKINNRAGIVHRLDRATSGVIITAKNEATLKYLQRQFSTRKTQKKYLAIVEGILEPKEAVVDADIERNPRSPQTFRVSPTGKPAITKYKLLKKMTKDGQTYSLVELVPLTGRTHQLRVHMASIGHPIVGDSVYNKKASHWSLMLHAFSLRIRLPSGEERTFKAPAAKRIEDFANE